MSVISIPLRCGACGGDLRGCDVFGLCAACHRPVSETIRVEALDQETLAIHEDVPCVGCGYNLRTLGLEARCPECARDVVDSLARNELVLADLKWLKRVRSGVRLLLAGLIAIVGAFLAVIIIAAGSALQPSGSFGDSWQWVFYLFGILLIVGGLSCVIGILRAATRERTSAFCKGSELINFFARFLVIAAIAIEFVGVRFLPPLIGNHPLWMLLLSAIRSSLLPASIICTVVCLRRIAILGKQKTLVRSSFTLIGTISLACGLVLYEVVTSFSAVLLPVRNASGSAWVSFGPTAGGIARFNYFIGFIIGVILLNGYRRMLSQAIRTANRRAPA